MLKANIQGFQERKAILYDRLAEGEIDRREFQNYNPIFPVILLDMGVANPNP